MTWLEAVTFVVLAFILYLIIVSYCDMKKTIAIEETKRVVEKPGSNTFETSNHPTARSPN